MEPSARPRVKICCMADVPEAWMAIRHGASAVGLVSRMPSGPGVISEQMIRKIAAALPPAVSAFLLTSERDASTIVGQLRSSNVHTVQICDRPEPGAYGEIRTALPGVSIVQVVHVTGEHSVKEAISVAPHVDAVLLDSGNQSSRVKELGGTGRTHDWSISRRIRELLTIPVFLAGGLTPGNIQEAIREVGPFAVDVCTGVRTDGRLDESKLSSLFDRINQPGCLT
jgi:phosphoribosylanthranilate isomerase